MGRAATTKKDKREVIYFNSIFLANSDGLGKTPSYSSDNLSFIVYVDIPKG